MAQTDEDYMRRALEQAAIALKNNWIPIGAIFVDGGRIITHACKDGIHHPLFDHAEHNGCYQALWSRKGPRNLQGVTVYSTLEPCIMCMSMLMTTRVTRIVYGLEDPYGGGGFLVRNPDLLPARFRDERPTLQSGVLAKESAMLLRDFFNSQEGAPNWSNKENPLVMHAEKMTA